MLNELPKELLFIIFSYLENYEDKFNLGLVSQYTLTTLIENSSMIKFNINVKNKKYMYLLLNLIKNFKFSVNNVKITCSDNILYLPCNSLINDFKYLNLIDLSISKKNKIVNKIIENYVAERYLIILANKDFQNYYLMNNQLE